MATRLRLCRDFVKNPDKLPFLVFQKGDDPRYWIGIANYILKHYHVPDEYKVLMSRAYVDYEIYMYLKSISADVSWDCWCSSLYRKFNKNMYGYTNGRSAETYRFENMINEKSDQSIQVSSCCDEQSNTAAIVDSRQGYHQSQPLSTTHYPLAEKNKVSESVMIDVISDEMLLADGIDEVLPVEAKKVVQTVRNFSPGGVITSALKVLDKNPERDLSGFATGCFNSVDSLQPISSVIPPQPSIEAFKSLSLFENKSDDKLNLERIDENTDNECSKGLATGSFNTGNYSSSLKVTVAAPKVELGPNTYCNSKLVKKHDSEKLSKTQDLTKVLIRLSLIMLKSSYCPVFQNLEKDLSEEPYDPGGNLNVFDEITDKEWSSNEKVQYTNHYFYFISMHKVFDILLERNMALWVRMSKWYARNEQYRDRYARNEQDRDCLMSISVLKVFDVVFVPNIILWKEIMNGYEKKCLRDAKMYKNVEHKVVAVFVSIGISKVDKPMHDLFNGKVSCKSILQYRDKLDFGHVLHGVSVRKWGAIDNNKDSVTNDGHIIANDGKFGLKASYEHNHITWDPGKQAKSDGSKDEGNNAIVAALGEYRSIYKNKKFFIMYLISSKIGKPAFTFITTALGMYDHSLAIQLVNPLNHRTCAPFDSSSYIDALNAESRFADHFGMHTMCSFMDHTEISTCPARGPDKRSVIVRGIYTSYHLSEEHKIIYVQEFTRKRKCIFVFIHGKEGQISILFNGAGNMNFDWICKDNKMHEDGPVKDYANPGLKKPRERVRILVSKHYQLPDNLIKSGMVDKYSMKVSHYGRWCISLEDNLLMKYMGLLSSSGSGIRRIIETLLMALLNDWLQQRNQQQKLGIKSQQQVVVECSLIYSMYHGRSITFNGCILVNGGIRNSGNCVTVSRTVQDSVGYCFYELSQRCLVSDWSLLLKLCISCLVFVATKLPSILGWFVPKFDCAAIGELVREMKLSALFKVAGMYEVAIQLGLNSDYVCSMLSLRARTVFRGGEWHSLPLQEITIPSLDQVFKYQPLDQSY